MDETISRYRGVAAASRTLALQPRLSTRLYGEIFTISSALIACLL
jgi:hypothetical protein